MTEEAVEDGPGAEFRVFLQMENLIDKLKLLNYDNKYCKELRMKPLSRHYFALATNPGEQFHAFTSLAAWLITMSGSHMDQPQEFDDPNAIISQITESVRAVNGSCDFPPQKLKSGCGEAAVATLDTLADAALKGRKFAWRAPEYPEEAAEEENIIEDDDNQLELNKLDAAPVDDIDDDEVMEEDEENDIMDLEGLKKLRPNQEMLSSKPEEILESKTDSSAWRLEVERVLPQLKVTIRTDNKDWRSHVEAIHLHKQGIDECYADAQQHLDRLHDELTRTLEKIGSREKYLNSQLEHLLSDYRRAQDSLSEIREKYRTASVGITERTRLLMDITEELERIKMEMEERGSSMTDGSPVARIKQAIQRMKLELNQMDIRGGVLEHILLQAKLKAKTDTAISLGVIEDSEGLGYMF